VLPHALSLGCSQCEKELERLELLYRDSLKMLIEEARVTLLQQWDRLHVSKEERVRNLTHATYYVCTFVD
jgi:hypothetical protein